MMGRVYSFFFSFFFFWPVIIVVELYGDAVNLNLEAQEARRGGVLLGQ